MPLPLSVAIVCKNNAAIIGRAVESVRGLAAEVVALDNGSTDGTIELLESMGVRVVCTDWLGYIKTKQKALEACRQPWVLSIDSDETVEPELARSIREVLARTDVDGAAYAVRRVVRYRGKFLRHAWQPEWRVRLVRAGAARWTGYDPHDSLEPIKPGTRVVRLSGVLGHDSISTFAEFLVKQVQHGRIAARELHAVGRRSGPLRLMLSPVAAFLKQIVLKRAFLDGRAGWLAASSASLAAAAKHIALIELSLSGQLDPAESPEAPRTSAPAMPDRRRSERLEPAPIAEESIVGR